MENVSKQEYPETISKTESEKKDDIESKESEERKEEVEVEQDTKLAWKPVQPKDVDESPMPPPPKPPISHTKDSQLMPPPPLPAVLKAKGKFIISDVFLTSVYIKCVCIE